MDLTSTASDGDQFPWQQQDVILHSQNLADSFYHWTGSPLLSTAVSLVALETTALAQGLFNAPFALLSHGTEADPILNYGNQVVLSLWQTTWAELTQMPSRLTAEPIEREERAKLLAQAEGQGYIEGYRGIRITRNGRRFWIENAQIWTVFDQQGQRCGQAAMFREWRWINR
jgi:hypothetical protein